MDLGPLREIAGVSGLRTPGKRWVARQCEPLFSSHLPLDNFHKRSSLSRQFDSLHLSGKRRRLTLRKAAMCPDNLFSIQINQIPINLIPPTCMLGCDGNECSQTSRQLLRHPQVLRLSPSRPASSLQCAHVSMWRDSMSLCQCPRGSLPKRITNVRTKEWSVQVLQPTSTRSHR